MLARIVSFLDKQSALILLSDKQDFENKKSDTELEMLKSYTARHICLISTHYQRHRVCKDVVRTVR